MPSARSVADAGQRSAGVVSPSMSPLCQRLASIAEAHLTESQRQMAAQFLRFGTVGLMGLVVDTATVYALRYRLGLYGAGLVAYGIAATVTWLFNRIWTFQGQGSGTARAQWLRFLAANFVGFLLNRGTYAVLIATVAIAARQPVIATSAGAIAGMFVNFGLSRRLVFR
jgi:putative flippase GtrA